MTSNTTVFCAVWHKDPDRFELLRGHHANLMRQTRVPEVVYVFDGGDRPPEWLQARSVVASQNLTIYEAWNLGITMARTPFLMNLNLDDRLSTDAVAVLEQALEERQAWIAGGDWKICFTQEETDATGPSYPAMNLPFDGAWPPLPGRNVRLGSGTGDRGTYGPATMWRVDLHMQIPRYPYRATNGQLIKGISDALFWGIATEHLKLSAARVPMVIGHYFSHPGEQAEFRYANEDQLVHEHGIALL